MNPSFSCLHIPLIEGEKIRVSSKDSEIYVGSNLGRMWKITVRHPYLDAVEMTQEEIDEFKKKPYDDGYPKS